MRTELDASSTAYYLMGTRGRNEICQWLRDNGIVPEQVHTVRLVDEGAIEVLWCPNEDHEGHPYLDEWVIYPVGSPPPSVWFEEEDV